MKTRGFSSPAVHKYPSSKERKQYSSHLRARKDDLSSRQHGNPGLTLSKKPQMRGMLEIASAASDGVNFG